MKRSGRPAFHTLMTPNLLEALDGLLLGAARLVPGTATAALVLTRRRNPVSWLIEVAELLRSAGIESDYDGHSLRTRSYFELRAVYDRWYEVRNDRWQKQIPSDVRLTPKALALWFCGAGSAINRGYAFRFATRHFPRANVEQLVALLRARYGWNAVIGDDKGPVLRLVENGDRQQLRRLVAPLVLPWAQSRLQAAASASCSRAEAARRRRPVQLTPSAAEAVRVRALDGEAYKAIAVDVGVGARQIGKIARGACWAKEGGVAPIRRRKSRSAKPAEAQANL